MEWRNFFLPYDPWWETGACGRFRMVLCSRAEGSRCRDPQASAQGRSEQCPHSSWTPRNNKYKTQTEWGDCLQHNRSISVWRAFVGVRVLPLWKHRTVQCGTCTRTPPGPCQGLGLSTGKTLHNRSSVDAGVWSVCPAVTRNSPLQAQRCTCCRSQDSSKYPQAVCGKPLVGNTECFPWNKHRSAAPTRQRGGEEHRTVN